MEGTPQGAMGLRLLCVDVGLLLSPSTSATSAPACVLSGQKFMAGASNGRCLLGRTYPAIMGKLPVVGECEMCPFWALRLEAVSGNNGRRRRGS